MALSSQVRPRPRRDSAALDGPVTIELGPDTLQADHQVVRAGRDAGWGQLCRVRRACWPDAAEYEKKTDRKFPVALITVR